MHILGIDPGLHGAYALFNDMTPVWVKDMETVAGVLVIQPFLKELLEAIAFEPLLIVLEQQQYIPPGGKGAFTNGYNYGRLTAFLELYSKGQYAWTIHTVKPAYWKRVMGLTKEKEISRAKAIQRWPSMAHELTRKKDEGRAEAMLLAAYGYQFVYWLGRHNKGEGSV